MRSFHLKIVVSSRTCHAGEQRSLGLAGAGSAERKHAVAVAVPMRVRSPRETFICSPKSAFIPFVLSLLMS